MFALTRFEIESSRFENGQLLVSGKGLAGERIEDALYMQPHGAASHPPKGAIGFLMSMPGKRTQAIMMGIEHPGSRPDMPEGDAALYDSHGNGAGIRLSMGSLIIDAGSRTVTITGGNVVINGDVTVNGTFHATGNITSDAPDGADE